MNPSAPGSQVPTLLLSTLRRVLRPLVRLMVAHGVQYPMLLELLKTEFVRVAEREFALDDKGQTDSRISLLTGVHRKDVRRLRNLDQDDQPLSPSVSLGGQIAAAWMASPVLTDAKGNPLPLPRLRSVGGQVSFEALVGSLSKDVRPRAVLDEWLRLGAAHVDPQDRVILNSAAFIPNKGFEEKLHYFAQNGHDHLQAMAHNVSGATPPFLDRSVYYTLLTPECVRKLSRLAERQGMRTIQTINRNAARCKAQQPKDAPEAIHRINFGIYFYVEPRVNDDVIPAAQDDESTSGRRRASR